MTRRPTGVGSHNCMTDCSEGSDESGLSKTDVSILIALAGQIIAVVLSATAIVVAVVLSLPVK